jgi:hypothetical protein
MDLFITNQQQPRGIQFLRQETPQNSPKVYVIGYSAVEKISLNKQVLLYTMLYNSLMEFIIWYIETTLKFLIEKCNQNMIEYKLSFWYMTSVMMLVEYLVILDSKCFSRSTWVHIEQEYSLVQAKCCIITTECMLGSKFQSWPESENYCRSRTCSL